MTAAPSSQSFQSPQSALSSQPALSAPSEHSGPSARAVADFLLALHQASHELGYVELQRHCMRELQALVPFDSGLMAVGTVRDGVPYGHDVMLFNQPPEMMESWDRIKHQDLIAVTAMSDPGRTSNHDVEGPVFDQTPEARAHCRTYGMAHVLCTAHVHHETGLYWVMSVYRADPSRPFSETERQTVEIVIPHVLAAARQARLGQLRVASRVPESHGQAAAVVNDEGLVLEAEPGLVELLRAEWPGWSGPWLPEPLRDEARAGGSSRKVRQAIVTRLDAAQGVRLLHVRRPVVADQLTDRQREIAEAFSLGETHREIGDRLGLSPNTVRRHLANIYEKLGIASKAELDRMLGGSPR